MEQNEAEKAAHNNYPHGRRDPIGSRYRSLYEHKLESFKAGAEWQKEQSQKEIDRLNAYIEDLSKGYEH